VSNVKSRILTFSEFICKISICDNYHILFKEKFIFIKV
ncbi:hypothetical protein LEP1GSC170_0911, partial [Leptospira interrogans serovar Bataviae str. HAI135]